MENCTFTNNTETDTNRGGVIQILDSEAKIENTTFRGNSAYSGGAITFECTSMANCELNIEKSEFTSNSAQLSGGAIYYNYNYPRILNSEFGNNKADYGPDFASYPAKIGLAEGLPNEDIALSNIGSGIIIDEILKLAIFDVDNQIMNLDNSSTIIILQKDIFEAYIKETNVVSVDDGVAQFDNIAAVAIGAIRSSLFTLNSKSIDTKKVSEVLGSSFTQKDLQIIFRD